MTNAAEWFYGQSFHDHAPKAPAPKKRVLPQPAIEDSGRGWFRVVGAECGPFDRYGRENAERALEQIKADRAASTCLAARARTAAGFNLYAFGEKHRCAPTGLGFDDWLDAWLAGEAVAFDRDAFIDAFLGEYLAMTAK